MPKKHAASWKEDVFPVPLPFAGRSGPVVNKIDTPADAFGLFMGDEDIVTHLVRMTNKYALLKVAEKAGAGESVKSWNPVTVEEMRAFLAVIFVMGIVEIANKRDYWSTDEVLHQHFVTRVMSRDRFFEVKRNLAAACPTLEESQADRLAKVRPVVAKTQSTIKKMYLPGGDLGLDESQIQCASRYARFSYRAETRKPKSDYIKVIAAHEAKTGYCAAFHIDTRTEQVHDMVLKVVDHLPQPGGGRRIASDRFYTTVDTARALVPKGYHMYGTVRKDRGPPTALKQSIASRKLKDGETRWLMSEDPLLVAVWRDTTEHGVWFLSTCHQPILSTVFRRKKGHSGKIRKNAFTVAVDYNENMGACDQCNAIRHNSSCQLRHHRRWYMGIIYYCLDILMINSYIYYKRLKAESIPLKQYILAVCRALASSALADPRLDAPVQKRIRIEGAKQLPPARLLHVGSHFAQFVRTQRNCKLCYYTAKAVRRSQVVCTTCNVHLCLNSTRNCFKDYHTHTHGVVVSENMSPTD
jgi:hypothetical protein